MNPTSRQRTFVAIACYRDPECQHTIRDLFEKAARPDRVFLGVVWQCDREKDADCFALKTRPAQVREEVVHPSEARGPCWARSRCEQFWDGEAYVMQVDSHMRFCPEWDQGGWGQLLTFNGLARRHDAVGQEEERKRSRHGGHGWPPL